MAAGYRCAGVRPLHMLTPPVETQLVKQESPSLSVAPKWSATEPTHFRHLFLLASFTPVAPVGRKDPRML